MKIGFVLDGGLAKPDGVQQYILNLGEWLIGHGHEVRYLVGGPNPADIKNVYSMSKSIKVRFNGNNLTIPLPASRAYVKKVLNEEKFDILHIQVPYSPFMGARVVKHADKTTSVIGTFHILPYGWLSRLGTHLLGVWLRLNLKRFDKHVAVSRPAAIFAKQTFKIDCEVVPNSVNVWLFKSAVKETKASNSLKLLFFGRLVHRKGCQQLLKALAILKKGGRLPKNVTLNVGGDGPLRQELEQFVDENDLKSMVTFHGFTSEAEKIKLMRSADISIFPSLSGESFGIVLIEAMAAGGGIVLGGNNSGYSSVLESVPDSIIEADNPKAIADRLAEIIENRDKRERLYKAQQELVKQFDQEVVGSKILKVYETCKKGRLNQ